MNAPRLIQFNQQLASDLGLRTASRSQHELAAIFSGNVVPDGAEPIAMAYAGHQIGVFVPLLGDGRAILLGEVLDRNGIRRDIQLKGSGPTPFSRRGDGRAALGPVLREYLISEAMHALGIPTTRTLAAVSTGQSVFNENALITPLHPRRTSPTQLVEILLTGHKLDAGQLRGVEVDLYCYYGAALLQSRKLSRRVDMRTCGAWHIGLVLGVIAMFLALAGAAVAGPLEEGTEAYQREDYATALELWRPLAEQGVAEAQFNLGFMYAEGQGVPQDYAEAEKWCRKAAEQGYVAAQTNLGVLYANQLGMKPDYAEAMKWLSKAAEHGDAIAQFNLAFLYARGRGVAQDYAEAARWLRKAADQGDAVSQFNLGLFYANGQGVPKDYTEAAKWYRKAADQGDAAAQFNLGFLYAKGKGVPPDPVEAAKWYRKAADEGFADAQFNLGLMYWLGQGVSQDFAEGTELYRLAASQGDDFAQFYLGEIYESGQGVPQDFAQAAKWYRLAADQGNARAQFNLGEMYESGQVPQDNVQGYMWLDLAVAQFSSSRTRFLGVAVADIVAAKREALAAKMTPAEIAEAQLMSRQWEPTKPPGINAEGPSE